MVETEVKIKVRLELDEGDKAKIREQAKAIAETGNAPINRSESEPFQGGIFGDIEDPDVKGFEKRQAIGGGVERLRDRTSNAPVDLRSTFEQARAEEKVNAQVLKEQEKRIETQEKSLASLISNPQAFVQDKLERIFKNIPFITPLLTTVPIITAIIAAPQMVDGMIKILKSSRVIGVFKRDVLNELNPFLTREQQRARLIGERGVIFTNTTGFASSNGNLTTNTLAQVRANGISDIGLRDKSGGLF